MVLTFLEIMGVNRISKIYDRKAEIQRQDQVERFLQNWGKQKILHLNDFQYFPISFKNGLDFFGNLPYEDYGTHRILKIYIKKAEI